MLLSIPTPKEGELYVTQSTRLAGKPYVLSYFYATRIDAFFLTIADSNGVPIAANIPLAPGRDILRSRKGGKLPWGRLTATTPDGDRVRLSNVAESKLFFEELPR